MSEESWDTAAFTKCGSGVGVQAGRGRSLEMTPDLRPPGSAPRVVTLPKVFSSRNFEFLAEFIYYLMFFPL